MTDTDLCEAIFHGLSRDARLLGCARAEQLEPYISELEAIADEIARALEKARRKEAA